MMMAIQKIWRITLQQFVLNRLKMIEGTFVINNEGRGGLRLVGFTIRRKG